MAGARSAAGTSASATAGTTNVFSNRVSSLLTPQKWIVGSTSA